MKTCPYTIRTTRFTLRCWNPADAPLAKDAVDRSLVSLQEWLGWADGEPAPLEAHVELRRHFRSQFDSSREYVYGIFTPDESRVIGGSGIHPRLGPDAVEIGYWIADDFQNRGYATDVTRILTDVSFRLESIDRVEIHVHPDNHKSARVPEKLGYTLEAVLKRRMRDIPGHGPGDPQDMMLWSMFRADWKPLGAGAYTMLDCMGKPQE